MTRKMKITINAELHPGQELVHQDNTRFKVISAGRRWGKTRLGVYECIQTAIRGGIAWWVAPTYRTGEVGWRPLVRILKQVPGIDISKTERTIRMVNGGIVSIRSADKIDNLRGEGLDYIVLDEAAYMEKEIWYEVLRASLSDKEGKALFISTPKGKNWFYEIFMINNKNWKSYQFTSYENPYIKRSEIEDAKAELPNLTFSQEYLGQFVTSEGQLFKNIDEVAILDERSEPRDGEEYYGSVDIGILNDYTVIWIWEINKKEAIKYYRFNKINYIELEERIKNIYLKWKLIGIVVESNAMGLSVIDHIRELGLDAIGFHTTNVSKEIIINNLIMAFEKKEIKIVKDEKVIKELVNFEGKINNNGNLTYSGKENDDIVMALAIGYNKMKNNNRYQNANIIMSADPIEEIDQEGAKWQ